MAWLLNCGSAPGLGTEECRLVALTYTGRAQGWWVLALLWYAAGSLCLPTEVLTAMRNAGSQWR